VKKLITSKKFIAGALAVLCVGILVVCLIVNNDKKGEFVPDPTQSADPVDTWEENPSSSPSGGGYAGTQGANDAEEYPKIVEENEGEVVIDFTDPIPSKEPAPTTPGTDADHVDHDVVPVQTPSEGGKPQEQSSGSSNTPAPGSKNSQGQVYDPAFGWITPADVTQESIDSDGDPNKMVGEMGGN